MPAVPNADPRPVVAITMGDPAGIGPEVVARAFADRGAAIGARRVVFGDARVMKRAVAVTGAALGLRPIRSPQEGHFGPSELEVVDLANADPLTFEAGRVSAVCGRASWEYVEAASRAALAGEVDAVVTAPINKESIAAARLPYVGHTEMLAGLGVRGTLAVAGLNPHCGEHGLFGDEEGREIEPAVAEARARGLPVAGPIGADSVFHLARTRRYAAVLSLYHDQGHIACKTLDFERTISLTLGLPFLRTSVDHGTAFDIAWTGKASGVNMIEAIAAAARHAKAYRTNHADRPG